MKIMIVVTHLLGSGHLSRALTLGRAFLGRGDDVTVVSGGMPAPHLDAGGLGFVQLPPLKSDGVNFTRLLDDKGAVASDGLIEMRQRVLLETLAHLRPDVVITELFPFGRRVLRHEFNHLLEAAINLQPRPLICASIRDILAPPSKPAKAEITQDIVMRYYDAVLVHSDVTITPLNASWPVTPTLSRKLIYTGFVAPPKASAHPEKLADGDIIVSAGGGDVGTALFETALQAAQHTPHWSWRLLIAGRDAAARIAAWQNNCPPNALLEPANPAFRQMLTHAAASVSLCGYNTALDILQAGTPAVFVPFGAGNEVEQSLRAQTLSELGGIEVVEEQALTPMNLIEALNKAMTADKRTLQNDRFEGALNTVDIVHARFDEARR